MLDLRPEQINQLDELELQNLHGRLHAYFRQLISGEKKFNREDLVNQKIFVLEEMRRRDMKHKVRDMLDKEALTLLNKSSFPAWLASFPENKELLWSIQDKLGFTRNEKADNDGLHCTIALFDNLNSISEIKVALEKADIEEFEFISTGINAYGQDLSAIVLEGTISDKLQKIIEKFRTKFDDTDYSKQYLPHITLGYANEQMFNLLSDKELDKLVGIKIKMSNPVLMVSIEKSEELAYSFIPEDEEEIELALNNLALNKCQQLSSVGEFRINSLKKKLSHEFEEALKKVKELVVIENVCSITGSSALPDKESNDIDLVWRMEFDDDGYARIDLRNILMKFDRAFPNEVSDKFDHISSPSGPNWSYINLFDLVLRAKNTFLDVTHVDESYAYHKALANVPGVGGEWRGETFWTNLKDELNKLLEYAQLIDNNEKADELLSMISDYLASSNITKQKPKEVQLMKPFKPIKSKAGLYEYEFFVGEEDTMWRTFARPIIEG